MKGVGVMKEEELNLEEIESFHTLGGYERCRYSDVRYTGSSRICYRQGKGLVVAKKTHGPCASLVLLHEHGFGC